MIKLIPGSLDIDLLIYDFRIGLILFKLILFTLITDFPRSWLKGSDKIISSNSTVSEYVCEKEACEINSIEANKLYIYFLFILCFLIFIWYMFALNKA